MGVYGNVEAEMDVSTLSWIQPVLRNRKGRENSTISRGLCGMTSSDCVLNAAKARVFCSTPRASCLDENDSSGLEASNKRHLRPSYSFDGLFLHTVTFSREHRRREKEVN